MVESIVNYALILFYPDLPNNTSSTIPAVFGSVHTTLHNHKSREIAWAASPPAIPKRGLRAFKNIYRGKQEYSIIPRMLVDPILQLVPASPAANPPQLNSLLLLKSQMSKDSGK